MEEKTLSICVADLNDFTQVCTHVSPKQSCELLQHAYDQLGGIVEGHNGQIWKYVGDAVLTTFARPADAINAAKDIVNCSINTGNIEHLTFSVGVATGSIIMAKIGHHSLRQLDIFGKPVNDAFRLASKAKFVETSFLLCPETEKSVK